MLSPLDDVALRHVEGPRRYTPMDVAHAFARAAGRPVGVTVTPRARLQQAFEGMGFSAAAAASYARMTALSIESGFTMPDDAVRGRINLEEHLRDVIAPSPHDN